MSQSSDIRSQGFNTLLAINGEVLTSGVSTPTAILTRKVERIRDDLRTVEGRRPDFTVLGMSSIELLKTAMAQPTPGQVFADVYGFSYSVKYVLESEITWFLFCKKFQTA